MQLSRVRKWERTRRRRRRRSGKGRRTSTASTLFVATNQQQQQQLPPRKPPRTIGSQVKRRRKSINESDSRGAFGVADELVEAILLKLDAPALASLQATSKYFRHSGVCDRVARFILATRDGEPGFDENHRGEVNDEEEERGGGRDFRPAAEDIGRRFRGGE